MQLYQRQKQGQQYEQLQREVRILDGNPKQRYAPDKWREKNEERHWAEFGVRRVLAMFGLLLLLTKKCVLRPSVLSVFIQGTQRTEKIHPIETAYLVQNHKSSGNFPTSV